MSVLGQSLVEGIKGKNTVRFAHVGGNLVPVFAMRISMIVVGLTDVSDCAKFSVT